jgi:uncharacterized membrane protein
MRLAPAPALTEDHRPPMIKKFFRHHLRLTSSAAAAIVIYFVLPHAWEPLNRVLISWNAGVLLFLVLACRLMFSLNPMQLTKKYQDEDEAAPVILVISIVGAVLAMASIVVFLSGLGSAVQGPHIALAALTVIDTWVLIPTMFTMHYADMYYSVGPKQRPLRFPDSGEPVFWDFAYFSFTISAACQTADVSTAQGTIRKVVIAHSVLSFFFNASILGFAINVTAGLIGK